MKKFLTVLILMTAAFTSAAESWEPVGTCSYTDDILCAFFRSAGNQTYDVMLEKSVAVPGLYRLVNPYGKAYPLNSLGDYDTTSDHYMIVHAENKQKVYIDVFDAGIDWGYGTTLIGSYAADAIYSGTPIEDVEANLFGSFDGNILRFPTNALWISFSKYKNGTPIAANQSGAFALTFPDAGVGLVETDGEDTPGEYFTLGGVRIAGQPAHAGVYMLRRGGKVEKVIVKGVKF